jgi:hypothetical protein
MASSLVVRHENESDANLALERFQFHLHLAAEVSVQRGQRFIEQQERSGAIDQGPQGDAPLPAAADFGRLSL